MRHLNSGVEFNLLDVSLECSAEGQLSELLPTCLNLIRRIEWGSTDGEYREHGNERNDDLAAGCHFFKPAEVV